MTFVFATIFQQALNIFENFLTLDFLYILDEPVHNLGYVSNHAAVTRYDWAECLYYEYQTCMTI